MSDFYIIHKDALPECFLSVLKAKDLVELNGKSISDVCKELDISRSTYYKYKDKVFEMVDESGRKAILSFKTAHEKGILSSILNEIAKYQGNVLTINQDLPIRDTAFITVMIDMRDLTLSIYDLIGKLKKIQTVKEVTLVAFE